MGTSSTGSLEPVKLPKNQMQKLVSLLQLDFKSVIQEGVHEYIQHGARFLIELLMAAEVTELCGDRHERSRKRKNVRWGSEPGTAILGGGKAAVDRPRVRTLDKQAEVQLDTYKAFNERGLLTEPLMARLLAGVSTRRYTSTIESALRKNGVSRSSVSRAAIAATKPTVDNFFKRRLESLDLVVLLLDGISLGGKQMIVCIAIDTRGRKHLLGAQLGATENFIVCRDLLRDLKDRGLKEDVPYLFVIDGAKALVQAIRTAFGDNTAIQRCQEHKIRNVEAYLPRKRRHEFRSKLQAAYNQKSEKAAGKRLEKIRLELSLISDHAANALVEGLQETLTVHRLGIRGMLRKSLRTTNIIESAFSSARRYLGRVTSYKQEEQIYRWAVRSLLEAERHFRTVGGHRQLIELQAKLKDHAHAAKENSNA